MTSHPRFSPADATLQQSPFPNMCGQTSSEDGIVHRSFKRVIYDPRASQILFGAYRNVAMVQEKNCSEISAWPNGYTTVSVPFVTGLY